MMTFSQLQTTLMPYTKGKKHLEDGIVDLWKAATPLPNTNSIKIIMPKAFQQFVNLMQTENG
jgi:hypothetical protein